MTRPRSHGATGELVRKAAQTLCMFQNCPAYVQTDQSGAYLVAASPDSAGSPNAPNVFQGFVGPYGTNSVVFYNVPVLPPANRGVSRTFRVTNIRVPTVNLTPSSSVQYVVSASPSQVIPVSTTVTAGIVQPPMNGNVNAAPTGGNNPFMQCSAPSGPALAAQVSFTEGSMNAFKTRVAPLTNTQWAATGLNTGSPGQNVPGSLYNGFATNSESGLVLPAGAIDTGTVVYTARSRPDSCLDGRNWLVLYCASEVHANG